MDDSSANETDRVSSIGEESAEQTSLAQRSPPPDANPPVKNSCGLTLRPSTRCGDKLAPGDERTCKLGDRSYVVHAGKTMDPCKPAALVIDLPKSGEKPTEQLGKEAYCSGGLCWNGLGSGWVAEADSEGGGFIVVSPERAWYGSEGIIGDEPAYLNSLVTEMKRYANIDANRVYLSGSGESAHLAFRTACQYSQTFSGLSPNAGGDMFDCGNRKRALSIAAFASKDDNRSYQGTLNATTELAKKNNCKSGPKTWRTFDSRTHDAICRTKPLDPTAQIAACSNVTSARTTPTTCTRWEQCDEGVSVVFCEVPTNNSHGWLNLGADAQFIYENDTLLNTPSVAWRVFQEAR